ncbi:hypothetical protein FB45DRAFT_903280 [Roridomyces roridus]|uniref:Uncharacterized protein n=1 Tax=Roridomyces roridus TaxID=1738132 RepID=A0AAD7FUG1_9AGAR|nr:hypothetical protein FB45DRAFT_903280 [Roridomyces roridus]
MVLGEIPITSYFPLLPKKRKRAKASTSFVPTKKQRPNEKQKDRSLATPRTPPSNPIDLTEDSPDKSSCSTARASTGAAESSRRKTPSLPIDLTADSPVAKRKARFLSPRNNGSEIVDDIPPSPTRSSPPPTAYQFDDFVPSSQTQYLLPIESDAETDFIPSSQSQYFPPERDDDGFVVPQWLLPKEVAKGSPEEEFVPTSQSQFELELQPRIRPEIEMAEIFEQPPLDASDSEDDAPVMPPKPPPAPVRSPSPSQDAFSLSGSSLPDALKVFSDCFPESFPQSLKWKEREDTPE